MNSGVSADKTALRRRLRAAVLAIPEPDRARDSARARELLRMQKEWKSAQSVLFYAPIAGEIDVLPLLEEALREGKKVALPRFVAAEGTYRAFEVSHLKRDCAPGQFGILEPIAGCAEMPLKRLDLALAPGLGFDVAGRRLGRGRGYYDRLLGWMGGAKCGVAFDQQLVGHIPAEDHDVTMNFILTPTRWLVIPAPGAVAP
jgi:5-formyltetrahydrofolate cyclo-ligase